MPEIVDNKFINTDNLYGTLPNTKDSADIHFSLKKEWTEQQWELFNLSLRDKALNTRTEDQAWEILVEGARKVMRNYTSSFFIVTRFLPLEKRRKVEAIYAAVRYPDEIVDTFKIPNSEKMLKLNIWRRQYTEALQDMNVINLLNKDIPPLLVAFTKVVHESEIPYQYYHSFLNAMQLDAEPVFYTDMEDLLNSYVYGSAIVVGYFLAYVYGARTPKDFPLALDASKDLGIALQLTNFMRDVGEDNKRNRLYIPIDFLKAENIQLDDLFSEPSSKKLKSVVNRILDIAEDYYSKAQSKIDVFSRDCHTAIQACIDVYRQLNYQIRMNEHSLFRRESVSIIKKFKVLPPSKYWRLPLAYLTDS